MLWKCWKIADREVSIYCPGKADKPMPLVFLHTVQGEGGQVYEECRKLKDIDFMLAAIAITDWYHDMSPWAIPPVFKKEASYGGADAYLSILLKRIVPEVAESLPVTASHYALAGYSLAGLFALYAMYQTVIFTCMASASGSFWFPDFLEYVKGHTLAAKPDAFYFSLGNKESRTRNPFLSKVEEHTKWLVDHYKAEGIPVCYEENEGNHFRDVAFRMAKGISCILENL